MKIIYTLALLGLLTGCTQAYTANTKATWITPDGRQITYESNKEQVGLHAKLNATTGDFEVDVDKASTSEAAIQAALAQSQAMNKLIEAVLPLILKAAAVGATGGAAAPLVP